MKAAIGSWVLGAAAALSIAPGRGLAADAGVTWASVPTPQNPGELTMEARGVWTQSGTLHGYDGKVLLKLASKRPWTGLGIATIGSSIAIAGSETSPKPRGDDSDASYALPTTALYDATGKALWMQRWSKRPVDTKPDTLQLVAGPNATFFVAGMYSRCTTFGGPGKRHCAKEDEANESGLCSEDSGCQEPFRLQYDLAGQLKEARTFPGAGGKPTMGPSGDLAIVGAFRTSVDVPAGQGQFHVDGGLPGKPPTEERNQGLLLRYDARANWRWGRALVADRGVHIADAVMASDGGLWTFFTVAETASATPSPIMLVGGKKARVLLDDAGGCGALLQIDDKGEPSLRARTCDKRLPEGIGFGRLAAALTSGVFLIVPWDGGSLLDAESLKPPRKTVISDVGPPGGGHARVEAGGVVLWYHGQRAVWGLRGPANARIRGAYDPSDGRVCVLFDIKDRRTWDVASARVTVGEAKKPTTQIGCFTVPVSP